MTKTECARIRPDVRPTYRGVPNTELVWRGTQSDPAIDYKGHRINYYDIEDCIWEDFVYYHPGYRVLSQDKLDAGFQRFVETHAYYVYEYLDNAIESGAPEAPHDMTMKEIFAALSDEDIRKALNDPLRKFANM